MANQNKQSGVFATIRRFGSNLLANLKSSLKEQSPSKATNEMGRFLLEGLGLGIEHEEKGLLKQVSNLGKSILQSFDTGISQEALTASMSSQIQGSMPTNQNIKYNTGTLQTAESNNSYDNMVKAFEEALRNMKIELDDEEAAKFVRKTVEDAIYT